MIIWDSNKFSRVEMVLEFFFFFLLIIIKLFSNEKGSFWLTSVYGPNF